MATNLSTTASVLTITRAAQPNLDPRTQTVLNRKVTCITYDKTNPSSQSVLSEGYIVTPNFVPTEVSGGIPVTKKFIVKLGSTDYAIKFHLPQGGENIMYITFAVKNSSYIDGYQDYITTVPSTYITALKTWCGSSTNSNIERVVLATTTILKKRLIFSFIGRLTTDIDKMGKFNVDFTYQTSITPLINTTTITTDTTGTANTERFTAIR